MIKLCNKTKLKISLNIKKIGINTSNNNYYYYL